MDADRRQFGVTDYCVFAGTLAISFGIGISMAFKGNKSSEDFLLGSRSLPTVPVAMSLLTSFIAAVNYLGFTTEVYTYGMQIALVPIGGIFGIGVASLITLPVIHPLELTSVHEYIELRFKSTQLRIFIMCLVVINAVIYIAACLYATALAISAVTPLGTIPGILLTGLICTAYATVGGIRAVIWTDVFQLIVTIIGLIAVLTVGILQLDSVEQLWKISKIGERLEIFNMNPSIYERHNFYNTLAFGAFFYSAMFGISQINVQRMCAVPTIEKAKKILAINAFGMAIIHFLIFAGGLVAYAVYEGCDPFSSGKIKNLAGILPYFVVDKIGFIPGLPGIFVSVLAASTLSTFSSVVNAQVAIIWEDLFLKFEVFAKSSSFTAALLNKILTCVIGLIFIGMSIVTSKTRSLIQLVLTVAGIIFGSIYGVFLLGMCFPRSNSKGAWAGLVLSCMFLSWIYIGSVQNVKFPPMLPLSTEYCNNIVLLNSTQIEDLPTYSVIKSNATEEKLDSLDEKSSLLLYLYGISYTLYTVIGPLLCVAIGIVVSYVTGPQDIDELKPNLITPFVRKFYWETELKPKEGNVALKSMTSLSSSSCIS